MSGRGIALQGTFYEGHAGAVERTLQSKLDDVVSVRDFGADATGATDSTAAIQAALTAAAAGSGSLYFPAGTYKTAPLTIPANVSIRGAARKLVTLNLTGMTAGVVGLTVLAGPNQIRSLTIQQTGAAPAGTSVQISGGTATAYHTVLDDLEFVAGGTAIEIFSTYGISISNTVIRRFDYGLRLHDNSLGFAGETSTITLDRVAFNDYCNVACISAVGAVTGLTVRNSIIQGGNSAATASVVLTPTTTAWPTAVTFNGVHFETGSGATAYPYAVVVSANVAGNFVNGVSITDSTFGGTYGTALVNILGGSRIRFDRVWNATAQALTAGVTPVRIKREEWNSNTITGRENLAYSASITPDATRGSVQWVSASNNTAFTINAPLTPTDGALLAIGIRNTAGVNLGTITWNAIFKTATGATWDSATFGDGTAGGVQARPATGKQRTISFIFDGTNWVEIGRTPADVTS